MLLGGRQIGYQWVTVNGVLQMQLAEEPHDLSSQEIHLAEGTD